MLGECRDHCSPAFVVLWRRDNRFVPKRLASIGGGQLPRHKAQLYERAHMILEHTVVDLVDVRKIVNGLAGCIFVVHADFVMEYSVEANVFEIGCGLHFAQVAAIAVAQAQNGAAGAEHLLPEMWKGMGGTVEVNFHGFRHGCVLGADERGMQQGNENSQQEMDAKWFHSGSACTGIL